MFVLPPRVIDRVPTGGLVVEIGVGNRYDAIQELAQRRGDLELRAVDVRPQGLEDAPAGVKAVRDDIWEPDEGVYEGAALLFAVRCPTELQPPLARLARRVNAALAINVVKDEWARLDPILGGHKLARHEGHVWRVYAAREGVTGEES